MTNLAPEEKKSEYITKKKTKRKPGPASELGKKLPTDIQLKLDDRVIILTKPQEMKTGGRAGYKDGSKGCKLAMKGKGKAYGKNS
jgi:hypothetical protein